MLADKTLLSVTLAATFASGSFMGYTLGRTRPQIVGRSNDPMVEYAPQMAELRAEGYDDAELAEAKQIYADSLNGYDYWVNEFLDVNRANLDVVDAKRVKRLEALKAKHVERAGGK